MFTDFPNVSGRGFPTITPGSNLDEQQDAMIAALCYSPDHYYLALANINVGTIYLQRLNRQVNNLRLLIGEYSIKEIILEQPEAELKLDDVVFSYCEARDKPLPEAWEALIAEEPLYHQAVNLLLSYLEVTQKQKADYIKGIEYLRDRSYLHLDYRSKLNLELIDDKHDPQKLSLYRFLNHCQSALGNRTLKSWVENPLRERQQIEYRLAVIEYLNQEFVLKKKLRDDLAGVYDIERISARINYQQANNRDLLALKQSIEKALDILSLLQDELWQSIKVNDDCRDVYQLLEKALNDDPQSYNKENQIFKTGYDEQLDHYRDIQTNGEKWIFETESQLREQTGIRNLKIGYNKVFGYYIEISKGNLEFIKPEFGFIRKQTLVNGERFITEQLKQREEEIIRSYQQAHELEKQLFAELLAKLRARLNGIQQLAVMLGWIDAIAGLAEVSKLPGYVRPQFNDEKILDIVAGKHPILAADLKKDYVANNCYLDQQLTTLLITGPNMGGKSTYIRQVALGVIMAQMGCYVNAQSFNTPIFDQIFTRIGASDDITGGQSTFMVEMNEANQALQNATVDSLVLFDELGRGTSTYDGMSLAPAMIEYLATCVKCKVLFSTHYHELVQLEDSLPALKNVNVKVKDNKQQIIFLYEVVEGKANKSYGINVAKLAHLPNGVILRANELLKEYEQNHRFRQNEMIVEMVKESPQYLELKKMLADIDINGITPIKALNLLAELKKKSEEDE